MVAWVVPGQDGHLDWDGLTGESAGGSADRRPPVRARLRNRPGARQGGRRKFEIPGVSAGWAQASSSPPLRMPQYGAEVARALAKLERMPDRFHRVPTMFWQLVPTAAEPAGRLGRGRRDSAGGRRGHRSLQAGVAARLESVVVGVRLAREFIRGRAEERNGHQPEGRLGRSQLGTLDTVRVGRMGQAPDPAVRLPRITRRRAQAKPRCAECSPAVRSQWRDGRCSRSRPDGGASQVLGPGA